MRDWNYRRLIKRRRAARARHEMAKVFRAMVAGWSDATLADCCNALHVKCDQPGWLHVAATVGLLMELERRQREQRPLRRFWTALVGRVRSGNPSISDPREA
jgi:hypothetical protein